MTTIPEKRPAPAWVDIGTDIIRGLDLLGLRQPALNIGYSLLNGISTISPSVRYLSLYTWIIESYRHSGKPVHWDSFKDFAVRLEAAASRARTKWSRTGPGGGVVMSFSTHACGRRERDG